MNEPVGETTKPEQDEEVFQPDHVSHWRAFAITSSVFCLVAFFSGWILTLGPQNFVFGFIVAATFFGQSQLSGIFAALSPQNYFHRLIVSQVFLAAVFFSFFGGLAIARNDQYTDGSLSAVALFAIVGSHGPQLVFGILRLAAGWRIHKRGQERGPAYVLKDLFTLTLFLAVSISALNGLFENFQNETAEGMFGFLFSSAALAIATLVYTVPTVAVVFRMKSVDQGCAVQFMVIASLVFVIGVPLLALGAPSQIIGAIGALICGCCVSTWLPLVILREQGFVITNGKESNSKAKSEPATSEESTVKKLDQ